MEATLTSLPSFPVLLWHLWLFHHLLCRLLLCGSLPWCFFFLEFVFNRLCFALSSLALDEFTCSRGFNYHLPADDCKIHAFFEIIQPTAHRISPSGGPHLCFESTESQMSPPAHLPTTTKIASDISVSWIYCLRGRLHFLPSHTK